MELHPFLEHDTNPNAGWWYVMTTTGDCPSMRVGHTSVYVRGQQAPTAATAAAAPAPAGGKAPAPAGGKAPSGDAGRVYVIGGANPSGPFCETFVLDLNTRAWDTVDSPGLRPRYEHVAFVAPSQPGKIHVFGGANQAGNMNDVQALDTATRVWSTLSPAGTPPAPRTHHTTAVAGDRLIVYSGGHAGADPVGDRQVYCFDAASVAWSVLTLRGDSPKPRHGHAMAAVGNKVLVHGGMAGATFYDDLHVLDLDKNAWSPVKRKRASPSARAAHVMAARGTDVYVFGGMNRDGALDDLYHLDTTSMTWARVELQGPPPSSRLDLAACVVELRVPRKTSQSQGTGHLSSTSGHAKEVMERELKPGSASSRDSWSDVNASEAFFPIETTEKTQDKTATDTAAIEETTPRATKGDNCEDDGATGGAGEGETSEWEFVPVLLLNGGMDTEGEIFDDTLIYRLP